MSTVRIDPEGPAPAPGLASRLALWLILAAAFGMAGLLYHHYVASSRMHWWGAEHDRHAHYVSGLNLAVDLRNGEGVQFLRDLDKLRIWGPLDPLLQAVIQLVAGPDYRLAVLPSLAAWVLTIVLAFLLTQRLLPTGGTAAGIVAAALVAVSPAHRAFATDAMLESPGACLTLLCVYCYVGWVQDNKPRSGFYLAGSLSLLFLLKCNYWVVVGLGLVGAEILRQPVAAWETVLTLCRRDRLARWLMSEMKQPLNYVALALVGAAGALRLLGGGDVHVAGQEVSIRQPHNLLHLACLVMGLRLLLWLWYGGMAQIRQWPAIGRDLALWHGGVVVLWFLMPKRLADFFVYLSPTRTDLPPEPFRLLHGLPFYTQAVGEDYLVGPVSVYLIAMLLALAVLALPRLKAGSGGVFMVFFVGMCLTCQHPMLKHRFMHSWIATSWVLASVGLIYTIQLAAGLVSERLRPWAAGLACMAALWPLAPAFVADGRAAESGIHPCHPPALTITDTYLPALEGCKQPTILGNMPMKFLTAWTFEERLGHRRVTLDVKDFKDRIEHNEEQVRRWLTTTPSDTLVLIDIHPDSPYFVSSNDNVDLSTIEHVLARGPFQQAQRWELPEHVSITLWKRGSVEPNGLSIR